MLAPRAFAKHRQPHQNAKAVIAPMPMKLGRPPSRPLAIAQKPQSAAKKKLIRPTAACLPLRATLAPPAATAEAVRTVRTAAPSACSAQSAGGLRIIRRRAGL